MYQLDLVKTAIEANLSYFIKKTNKSTCQQASAPAVLLFDFRSFFFQQSQLPQCSDRIHNKLILVNQDQPNDNKVIAITTPKHNPLVPSPSKTMDNREIQTGHVWYWRKCLVMQKSRPVNGNSISYRVRYNGWPLSILFLTFNHHWEYQS